MYFLPSPDTRTVTHSCPWVAANTRLAEHSVFVWSTPGPLTNNSPCGKTGLQHSIHTAIHSPTCNNFLWVFLLHFYLVWGRRLVTCIVWHRGLVCITLLLEDYVAKLKNTWDNLQETFQNSSNSLVPNITKSLDTTQLSLLTWLRGHPSTPKIFLKFRKKHHRLFL